MMALALIACGTPGTRAVDCGSCHVEQYAAWLDSPHAVGGSSRVFRAMLPEVRAAWGPSAEARCKACHEPGFGGEDDGISCVACHAAVGNRGEADGALVVNVNAPLAGPHPGQGAPHEVSDRRFLTASALCATCHEVTGPELLVEQTGTEHAEYDGPESCADCHLPDGDHGIPRLEPGGDEEAVRALLADAVELRVTTDPPGIEVENVGAGHRVPTGAAMLRDLRVDVTVRAAGGQVVEREGWLQLAPIPVADGVPVPLVTDATAIDGEGLAPGEVRWVEVPADPGAEIEARLVFRAYRPEVVEALGLSLDVPEIEVASAVGAVD